MFKTICLIKRSQLDSDLQHWLNQSLQEKSPLEFSVCGSTADRPGLYNLQFYSIPVTALQLVFIASVQESTKRPHKEMPPGMDSDQCTVCKIGIT